MRQLARWRRLFSAAVGPEVKSLKMSPAPGAMDSRQFSVGLHVTHRRAHSIAGNAAAELPSWHAQSHATAPACSITCRYETQISSDFVDPVRS